jgi:hypothetical protein
MLSLLLFVCIVFGDDSKKAPLSLKDVLQRTKGQLEGLSSSLNGYSKQLSSDTAAASDAAKKAVSEEASDIATSISDYKDSLNEIMDQVGVEMKDYNRELKELEENEADEVKELGKEAAHVAGDSKKDLAELMTKLDKVLADMKAQEEAAAKKAAAAATPAAPAKPAAKPAAPAAKSAAPAKTAGAGPAAQAFVIEDAESWVSSHFVLFLFAVLGAGLVFSFWNFQKQFSPLYGKRAQKSDNLVFTSDYYQATGPLKKTF